jgi:putative colanic acid biosynthesis acetyltransferase WcaF
MLRQDGGPVRRGRITGEEDSMSGSILPGSKFGSTGRARSFAWSHILFRLVWNLAWLLLCAWTPPQLHRWRRLVLNLFGAKISPGARVYGSARIWYPPNLEMGNGAVLGPHVVCYTMDRILLGEHCTVSQYCHVVTGTHETESETFQLYTKPVSIGSHAWLASGAFVGPGVEVGEGAVLGARGVTFRNLEPWTIYAGNPAKRIRARHDFVLEPRSGRLR